MCVCEGAGGKLGESVCVKLGALSRFFYTAYMYESHCPSVIQVHVWYLS